ncbi:MAG: flagellar hook-associated protein FlgL [Steroidobacteraceae bacterium]
MSVTRISTASIHSYGIAEMMRQQVALSKTQAQISSGQRVQTPADDPVAATRILGLERAQSQLDQYGRNAGIAGDRLSLGEQSMADLTTIMQRVQELTVKANDGALDNTSLQSIATELRSRKQEMLDIANRQDSNGEFLFAGFSTGTRPFADSSVGVAYAGDQGVRQLQISSSQKIADSFNGERVFMDIPQGNGTFMVTSGTHTGTGMIGAGQVLDGAQWSAAAAAVVAPATHEYTVRFIDPDLDGVADTWELLDSTGTAVENPPGTPVRGSYVDGGAISFDGIQFTLSGKPAVGDTFEVAPAASESLFTTLDNLIASLDAGSNSPGSNALLGSSINQALTQLDRGLNHVIDLRTDIGARLSALDTAEGLRNDLSDELTGSLSELRDLDYAEAISRLNQQMTGLQAAQAAYSRIGQLSLFDYIR